VRGQGLSWVCLIVAALDALAVATPARGAAGLSPAEILEALRAKDAQLDNANLRYATRAQVTTTPYPAWKFPDLAKQYGLENDKPEQLKLHYHEQMIFRGPDVTFIRAVDPNLRQAEGTRRQALGYQKWSNTDSLSREIKSTAAGEQRHLRINPGGQKNTISMDQRLEIELALGVGFGKRLQSIKSLQTHDGVTTLTGAIDIWPDDSSTYELDLDDHFLVRRSVIEIEIRGARARFETQTQGLAEQHGYAFAQTGSLKRISFGREVEGKPRPAPRVVREFSIEFEGIDPNLSDEAYRKLTSMEVPDGTQISDDVIGMVFFKGQDHPDVKAAIDESVAGLALGGSPPAATNAGHPARVSPGLVTPSPSAAVSVPANRLSPLVVIAFLTGLTLVLVGVWMSRSLYLRRKSDTSEV
jgi:hypothetical protein